VVKDVLILVSNFYPIKYRYASRLWKRFRSSKSMSFDHFYQ